METAYRANFDVVPAVQPVLPESCELPSNDSALLTGHTTQGAGIEIVVLKDDVAESQTIEFVHFLDDLLGKSLPRSATFRDPDGTETAILRTARDRLNAGKHVLSRVENVPSGFH